jgi:3-deoxy-manno-octulosonate cytidylyltransferase (CMP-KDO synthetase)
MKTLGIIPARYGSTRLPGKALIMVHGQTIIERTYRRAIQSKCLDAVVVATDDVRIFNHVRRFGGKAELTRQDHENGSSRCAEVAATLPQYDFVVNIQGDEPLIDPGQIDQLCTLMSAQTSVQIGTMYRRITNPEDLTNPAVAKVVPGEGGRILYFSRSPVPYVRDIPVSEWLDHGVFFRHVGMYAYRGDVLQQISGLPESPLERAEKLEQLNWLYHGMRIYGVETELESMGVDTPDDLARLEQILSPSNRAN